MTIAVRYAPRRLIDIPPMLRRVRLGAKPEYLARERSIKLERVVCTTIVQDLSE